MSKTVTARPKTDKATSTKTAIVTKKQHKTLWKYYITGILCIWNTQPRIVLLHGSFATAVSWANINWRAHIYYLDFYLRTLVPGSALSSSILKNQEQNYGPQFAIDGMWSFECVFSLCEHQLHLIAHHVNGHIFSTIGFTERVPS